MGTSIIEDWVGDLSTDEQYTLLCVVGISYFDDGVERDTSLTNMFKHLILNKDKSDTSELINQSGCMSHIEYGKRESNRWFKTTNSAINIIANKHPNNYVRQFYLELSNIINERYFKDIDEYNVDVS